MTATESTAHEVGKARTRKEDARLITGQTNWTDNITLPGLAYVAFVRSPHAHARIASVDVSAAHGASGVIAAFSGADLAAEQGSVPCASTPSGMSARSSPRSWPGTGTPPPTRSI